MSEGSDDMLEARIPRARPPDRMLLGLLVFLLLLALYVALSRPSHPDMGEDATGDFGGDAGPSSGPDRHVARATAFSRRECKERADEKCLHYRHTPRTWPDGIIPYTFNIDPNILNIETTKVKVHEAMEWWESNTCVRFIPTNSTTEISLNIRLENTSRGCYAIVGYHNHSMALLTTTCTDTVDAVGNIAHELGHVIGLLHEHNRPDRNSFITVHFDNIKFGSMYFYLMYSENYDLFDTTYDLDSIMHYPSFSGDSDNASLPVLSLNDDVVFNGTIGQRKCLSYYDIIATNLLYQCNMSNPERTSCNFHHIERIDTDQSSSGALLPSNNTSESEDFIYPDNSTTNNTNNNNTTNMSRTTDTINSSLIYPGDTVAFKSLERPHRWMGCMEERGNTKCYAWGCPIRTSSNLSHCWEYQFVVYPTEVVSMATTPLRFGDRVVLWQCRAFTLSTANCSSYIPLGCPGNGEQCPLVDTEGSCGSSGWNSSLCQQLVFRVGSEDGETRYLQHRDKVKLVGDLWNESSTAQQSLCCYEHNRRRRRTCQLRSGGICNGTGPYFEIFKLVLT